MNDGGAARSVMGDLLTEIFFETFRLTGEALELQNQFAKQLGISRARWQVLHTLEQEGHAMTVPQIARRMGLSRQAVQRIAHDLVDNRILTSGANPDHKRSPLIATTEKGRGIYEDIASKHFEWATVATNELSGSELEDTLAVIKSVREKLIQTKLQGDRHATT